MTTKTWFITGTSRGFGLQWATAALERGDTVAAAARTVSSLAELSKKYGARVLPLELNVNDRPAVFKAVAAAHAHFGRLDVIVNNAGYGHFGMVEEATEAEARAQLDTNFFGALWVTQAALPILRAQKSGHILQVSSIGGIVAFPILGMYHASKWALEGMSQALASEVAPFGIHVTIVEPGGFNTDWSGSSAVHSKGIAAYDELKAKVAEARKAMVGKRGDPTASSASILKLVDTEQPPLRLFLGAAPLGMAKAEYAKRLESWETWQPLAAEAQGH